ncbi:MAG: alginate export family protein [Chromatiaceae bacterium]|nr:alginate export family protein [Chromatiaceae bacterium]MCF7995486.1 alginate export family protein [Chromatiaceae bacterium]MCF8015144.1 alginate export family protein [Chromatiaceae bacterium]
MKRSLIVLGASLFLLALGVSAHTEASGGSKPESNPSAAAFAWGGDLRMRQVFINNVGLNDQSPIADRTFQRYRGRLWSRYSPTEQLSAEARLMWEGRHYHKPNADQWPIPGFETWYSGGLLFDQLALSLDQPAGLPLSFKVGRQDLILGHGWLVLEGTPLDGSRTIYFDAARATLDLAKIETRVDLIYLDQDATTGRFPRPLNGVIEDQIEQYETGAILYARNRSLFPETDLDGYFIYKQDRPDFTPGNIRVNNGAPFPSPSDRGDIYTVGLRAEGDLSPAWGLRAEGAYQWGQLNGGDLTAVGFNGRLLYRLQDAHDSRFHADLEYLSGDDPGDSADQAFDPLWGRWPQWSELMIYQWPLDSRVAQATNLLRLNLGWMAQVHPTSLLTFDYHALFANEESTLTPQQAVNLSGDGRFRGHLFTAWLKAKLSDHISGHLVAEYLAPGDFYAEHRRDDSYFLRAELVLHW